MAPASCRGLARVRPFSCHSEQSGEWVWPTNIPRSNYFTFTCGTVPTLYFPINHPVQHSRLIIGSIDNPIIRDENTHRVAQGALQRQPTGDKILHADKRRWVSLQNSWRATAGDKPLTNRNLGEGEEKSGAASFLAFHPEAAPVRLDDTFDDGQSEPQPRLFLSRTFAAIQ
jgi:hypothetical protein